ncbi:ski oncogene isoform X2 [Daktulosphaira vitifoliae]|uniref:ski oncogene isoform X2 n=1 Tax=Daktulosphaira vitifoliae TaxID=58002 RepID=UPI0021AA6BD9|nr:ski oncogene isoform X2 [Daktulosphaira vitifoliae]
MEEDKQQVNNPHIKKVLKTYQLSAPRSLQGPNLVLDDSAAAGPTAVAISSPKADSDSNKRSKTPPPPPLHPVLYVPDQSGCELFETELEWEKIACFMVGGEMRLCLPQILNTVLREFTLTQINQVCDELRIYCSRCTVEQLDVLKQCNILPVTAPSCGLMTKTNAERLCFALLHRVPPPPAQIPDDIVTYSFRVFHDVFGKTRGICMPELYTEKFSACIQCDECKALFTPQQFVNHIHRFTGTNSCHWGYKRENWRAYIKVAHGQKDYTEVVNLFETFKEQIDDSTTTHFSSRKRKQLMDLVPESCRAETPTPSLKRTKLEEAPTAATAAYYTALSMAPTLPNYMVDPFHYFYGAWSVPPPAMYLNNPHSHLYRGDSLIKRERPPRLVDPQKVISHSQSEQFGRSFQPNVALAPPVKINGTHMPSNINNNNNITKPTVKYKDKEDQEHKDIIQTQDFGKRYNSVAASVMEQVAAVLDALSDAKETTRQQVIELVEGLALRLETVESKNQHLVRENEYLKDQLKAKKHLNKEDSISVNDAMIKWEEEETNSNSLPLKNKRCSPVSVITSPPCQLKSPSPCQPQSNSVLIKSESIDC